MADSSPLKNPFVGLRAFEEDEDYLFFGRSAEINDLLKKFSSSRFLAVIGSSGSGKSSLVKSGLLPAIYSGFLSVGRNWRVALFRPGNDPIGNLSYELALEDVLYENVASSEIAYEPFIEATLRRSGGGLIQAYKQAHLAATENLLIVVDQFEELFRFSKYEKEANEGKSDALNFVNLLLTASQQQDCPIYVLLTMRSDFIGDCAQFRGLPEAVNDGQYLVPRMTRDEIREAITGPIAVGGAKITPRLITRLLNDVGNNLDQLPILQHAMMRTWDVWQKKNQPTVSIDIDDYDKIGGMSTALSVHAEEIYDELTTDKQRLICELMFKALTDKAADVRGIRRPTSVEDLCVLTNANENEVIEIVEMFRKKGRTFLMPPANIPLDGKSIIDISHESLMRVWKRLIKWADEEALSSEIYLRLSEAAKRYEQGEIDLWRNPELAIALRWFNNNNPNAKWAERYNKNFDNAIVFLRKSEVEAARIQREKDLEVKNKRLRAIRAIIALAIVLFFAIVGIGFMISANYTIKSQNKQITTQTGNLIKLNSSLKISERHADSLRKVADTNALIAYKAKAQDSIYALKAFAAESRAEKARDSEKAQKEIAQNLLEKTLAQNKQIAAAEYQKRIREGPTDEDSIIGAGWNYKYYACWFHLTALKAGIKNDELYQKLYYSLTEGTNKKADKKFIIERSEINSHDGTGNLSDKYSLGNSQVVAASNDTLKVIVNGKVDSTYRFKNKISSVATSVPDKHVFVASSDNELTVYKYDEKYRLVVESRIPMGSEVSALDYFDKQDIIFFGLKTGEIGFIEYHKDRKNQPVYKNQLDSRITAMDFFSKHDTSYLLATSSRGKAIVFELGTTSKGLTDYLKENENLTGIELPEYLGDIKGAEYLQQGDRIKLVIANNVYLWNPWVETLLHKLKDELSLNQTKLNSVIDATKYY